MKEKELRRSMAVFTIGTVMQLTDLTARQIRYYEEQELVHPKRTDTNRRMFSLNDVDRLLEVKDYLAEGLNITAIKRMYSTERKEQEKALEKSQKNLTDEDVRRILYKEILNASGFNSGDSNKPWGRI
ncbi:helix turn helix mercury resistance [Trichococcus palustris]|jgi:MerR family transcriptional regulator, glutamine synthetase repressor|uniref:Helix turn helix mercury resistance n=1 Tax=Trichococcus palustris TaxID=140314 RepID=A0A143YWI7_9LACT|nr:MerR family transcriptional regulator [Trichococcus palustris]CZR00618.1 helix turn helix mercury resistance [Trichococcus palustris]SFK89782.1 MerR family transcriptional regulator, glutamine synthetase repressor [Trichococcus palustris]